MLEEILLFEETVADDLILEATEEKHHKHLHHVEDLLISGGQKGYNDAVNTLLKTHDYLKGKRGNGYSLSTKYDGYPSVVWGHHPENNKFFVGTKSYFNKTPKVNFTDKDVDDNHGNSKTLSDKMKFLLGNLKGVSPKQGVFQGDLMYTSPDVRQDGSKLSFTPNTLTYSVDKNSYEGQKIQKSKVGIAAHTHYEPNEKGQLKAVYNVDHSEFKPSDDIHFLPTKLRGPFNYKSSHESAFMKSLMNAEEESRKFGKHVERNELDKVFMSHSKPLLGYINNTVKNQTKPSVEGYISFLYNQFNKRFDNTSLVQSKDSVKKQVNDESKSVLEQKPAFNSLLKMHGYLQDAKNTLIDVLSKHTPYEHSILGNPSKPEGFVASVDGHPIKLVNRQHFSKANFDWNEKVNPEDNPTVLTFGRFNPPTAGHERVINKGADIARRIGAKQVNVATATKDKTNNPLTPQQKVQFLKSMFPGQNISIAGDGKHTITAQLQHLHNSGVKDLTIVVGGDRVKAYSDILARYNGQGPGKLFQFRRARVVSAGERDEGSESVEGTSGTKQRQAAKKNDYKSFKAGMPKHVKDDEAQNVFHTTRAEMGVVKVAQDTPGHALAILAKRSDKTGKDAQNEIARRKRNGTWKGHTDK